MENEIKDYGRGSINNLNLLAYVILIGGVISGIIILIQDDGLIFIQGIALLFSSILTFAILKVVCGMADNIIAIRKYAEKSINK